MKKRNQIPLTAAALVAATISTSVLQADDKKDVPNDSKPKAEKREKAPREKDTPDPKPEERSRRDADLEKQTWLGVATTPIPPNLREYLDLPEGFGVQIRQVIEDSPAGKAGILANDIMVKLDDQKLTSPDHLAVLVRSMKSGDTVKITVIRKGAEKVLEATLGATDRPLRSPTIIPGGYERGGYPMHGYLPSENSRTNPREWQEAARHFQDRWEDWMKENHPNMRDPETPKPEKKEAVQPDEKDKPEDKPASNKTPALSVSPGFPLKIFGMKGIVKIDNEEGELTITNTDDGQVISILNRDGEEVYEGAFDPEKGVESLPKEAQEQLEKMKLDKLDILPMPPATEKENKVEEAGGSTNRKNEKGPVL